MVRTPSFDKNGIKKGAWSPEEDRKLEAYITRYGHWNWRELPKFAGLQRCGKSCRLRWMNYLRPSVRRGNYTHDEEDLIMELHQKHGNKWAMIAGRLPGRTDNEIKNHWHTHLKKRHSDKSHVSSSATDSMTSDSERSVRGRASSRAASSLLPSAYPAAADDDECFRHIKILESCPLSAPPVLSSSATENASMASSNSNSNSVFEEGIFDDMMSDYLFEFTPLGDPATSSTSINSAAGGGELAAVYEGLKGDDDFWTTPFTLEDMMSSYVDAGCTFIHGHGYSTADVTDDHHCY